MNRYGIQLNDTDYDPFADLMALGDGYMLRKWDADDLAETLYQLTKSRDIIKLVKDKSFERDLPRAYNMQQMFPRDVIDNHYDLGNNLFMAMLGSVLLYTCAYWKSGAKTLEQAQIHKVERINRKLELEDDMRVLDLGCGWGGYADITKLNYDVEIVGVTLSEESAKIARHYCDEVIVGDYSDAKGKFDRVISLGLLEHVGPFNYRRYMKTAYRCLKDDGIHLYQTIGYNKRQYDAHPWIDGRIFNHGVLPSFGQLADSMDGLFVLEDVENMGLQYARTTEAWYENFVSAVTTGRLKVSDEFTRMWKFYLMFFRAAFLCREYQLWQVVATKRRLEQPVRI